MPALEFVCESLSNPLTNRDILTQSSLIFWMMLKVSQRGQDADPFELLLACLATSSPMELFGSSRQSREELKLNRGLLQMSKIRGFVLTTDKNEDTNEMLTR